MGGAGGKAFQREQPVQRCRGQKKLVSLEAAKVHCGESIMSERRVAQGWGWVGLQNNPVVLFSVFLPFQMWEC